MTDYPVSAKRRRLHPAAAPIAVGVVGLAAAVMVHFIDPNEPGNYPTCPWLMLTGTFCPGCGTTRAVAALTHLDVLGAAQMNIFAVAVVPFVAFWYIKWLYQSFRPPKATRTTMASPVWLYLLLAAILLYWLVRNLPFGAFLAPGATWFA
ncbi:DUF2752 domain-containing protein [Nocardiopsis ansamitocini]|uniref:Membrane protein n=1 Tax=Nocardiopsis ansamitocini TaxID=1670832 RepID=A0A9W6P2G7_9ACTN|nr:DUF2752 domain-containing protein [Nocardiopsis ansamitocini]GLU45926.1 membrane protein [Nocardiopsis ansamitocini]